MDKKINHPGGRSPPKQNPLFFQKPVKTNIGDETLRVFNLLKNANNFDETFEGLNQADKDLYNSKIKIIVRFISSLILLISFCSILEYYFVNNAGGYLGNLIFTNLSGVMGFIGSLIFLVIFIIPASSLSFNFSWIEVLDFTGTTLLKTGNLALEVTTKIFQFLIINSKNITNSLIAFNEKEKIKKQENVTQKNQDTLKSLVVLIFYLIKFINKSFEYMNNSFI